MRAAAALPLAAIPLAALAGWVCGRSSPQVRATVPPTAVAVPAAAQLGGAGGGGAADAEDARNDAPRVYFPAPMTAEAARTWIKLQQKLAMPFSNDTPLEDVLKYIRSATAGKEKGDDPIQIYVDPVGLQEAEKTEQSPVKLSMENIPLSTSLGLLLKQLGLAYHVQKDGLLVITSRDSDDRPIEPTALILDRLDALQKQVSELQRGLGVHHRPTGPQAPAGANRGGFQ
jgi:hypothetical protein